MKNTNYKVNSFRLEEEVIKELKNRQKNFKSWNLMFRDLLFKKQKKLF